MDNSSQDVIDMWVLCMTILLAGKHRQGDIRHCHPHKKEIYDSVKTKEFHSFDSWQGDRSPCPAHHSANETRKEIIIYQIMIV